LFRLDISVCGKTSRGTRMFLVHGALASKRNANLPARPSNKPTSVLSSKETSVWTEQRPHIRSKKPTQHTSHLRSRTARAPPHLPQHCPPNPNPPEEPKKPPKQKGRNSTEACSVRDPDFEDKMTWGRKPKVLALAQSTNDKVLRASCLAWRQLSTGARAFGVDAAVPSASRKKSHRTGAKVLPTVQVSCLG